MVNTIMPSGSEIPYVEDFEDYLAGGTADLTSWSRFLMNAAKGSIKAADVNNLDFDLAPPFVLRVEE